MSMQIDYFLNTFQHIIDMYLVELSDPHLQSNFWFKKKPPISSFDHIVENFIIDVKDLFETPEYKHYTNDAVCLLVKKLYNKVEKYYFNIESVKKTFKEELLLNDPEWIEIQKLSKQLIDKFIIFKNKLRNKSGERND